MDSLKNAKIKYSTDEILTHKILMSISTLKIRMIYMLYGGQYRSLYFKTNFIVFINNAHLSVLPSTLLR